MSETTLNLELLNELSEIMGDDMEMLLEAYFEDSRPKIASLIKLDISTQQDAIYKLAHSIKGSSRNVGVVELSDYCEKLEKLARQGQLTKQDLDANLLNVLFQDACKALEEKILNR